MGTEGGPTGPRAAARTRDQIARRLTTSGEAFDTDSYFTNDKTDLGDYPVTGARLGLRKKNLGMSLYAAVHHDPAVVPTSTGGLIVPGALAPLSPLPALLCPVLSDQLLVLSTGVLHRTGHLRAGRHERGLAHPTGLGHQPVSCNGVRGQKSEVRSQRSEVRRQRSEVPIGSRMWALAPLSLILTSDF